MNIPAAVSLLIPLLVGSIAVPLIQFCKRELKFTDPRANLWLAFGVSVALAVLALILTESFTTVPGEPFASAVIRWAGVTFATATMVYKSIKEKENPPAG